jgi:putative transposase
MLVGKLAAFVEQEVRCLWEANTRTIGALNVQEDNVHLFLSAPPSIAPSQIAHTLKGTTARKVVQQFPACQETLMGRCPSRSRSCYVGSVGDMSLDTVFKYIELGQE